MKFFLMFLMASPFRFLVLFYSGLEFAYTKTVPARFGNVAEIHPCFEKDLAR